MSYRAFQLGDADVTCQKTKILDILDIKFQNFAARIYSFGHFFEIQLSSKPSFPTNKRPQSHPVMKKYLPYSLILAAAATGLAHGAATAYTTPVGYISHTVAAAGSLPSAETYLSASLVQATEFAGVSASATAKTVTFTGTSVPTSLNNTYVLEITSGPSEGWWSTVSSSTSSTIVLTDNFPVATPVSVSIRKHTTLKSFLGNNSPGFVTFNGVDNSDEVQIWDPVTQSVIPYAYISASDLGNDPLYPNGAWWDIGNSVVADNVVIEPGSAVRIKRIAGSLTFVSSGTVKTTKTEVDVYPNFNWVGTPLAVGGTLDGMAFNTQLNQYDGESVNFDELSFLDASQASRPFAAIAGAPPTMFDLGNSVEAGTEPFKEGTGAIIRRIGNPAGILRIPGSVVAQ